ncbi:MAG: carbohydrate ABC transporter permease [Nitrososphaerota archaeon]
MKERNWFNIVMNIILVSAITITFIPIYFLIITAFKSYAEAYSVPPTFFVQNFSLEGFEILQKYVIEVSTLFTNSLIIAIAVIIPTIIVGTMSGYAFVAYEFKFKEVIFVALLTKYLLPEIILIVPWYWIMLQLKFVNSLLSVIVVNMIGAWTIFFMRSYISQIPKDYIEAARIDGASENKILFRIIVPMARPAWLVAFVINFIWSWGALLWPLIILNTKNNYTLSIAVTFVRYIYGSTGESPPHYPALAATSLIYTIPALILYLLVQKSFIETFIKAGIKR